MSRTNYFHGVVSDDRISFARHEGLVTVPGDTVNTGVTFLLHLAEHYNLSTIWIAPGSMLSAVDPEMFCNADTTVWNIQYTMTNEYPGASRLPRMKKAVAWRHKGTFEEKRAIEIIFPEQGQWEWDEEDPEILLHAIVRLQADLSLPVASHPGDTGRELMKWGVKKELQVTPQIDLSQLPCKCGRDIAWKAPMYKNPHTPHWLHAYDKNSQYLSAASNATLGIGDPVYYGGAYLKPPDLKLAGLWHISIEEPMPGAYYHESVQPLRHNRQNFPELLADNQEWVTTPILKCLVEMGYLVTIHEGYEWKLSRRALAKWSEIVWGLTFIYKQDESPSGQVCYQSMKKIARASIGLLGSDKVPRRERLWARPDWWSTIVETAKARMIYNIDANGQNYGLWPSMVFVDCLYYVSDSPLPDKRLLARSTELGGYKHKGCIPITEEVQEWFNGDMGPAEVVQKINEQAEG